MEAGADVNLRDRWGNTPLWRAVYVGAGAQTIVGLLLAHGADPTLKNNHDVSPLDLARSMAADNADIARMVPVLEAASPDEGDT